MLLKMAGYFIFFKKHLLRLSKIKNTAGAAVPSATLFASSAINDKASASSMMSFMNMGSAMLAVIIMGYLPGNSALQFSLILIAFIAINMISGTFLKRDNQS